MIKIPYIKKADDVAFMYSYYLAFDYGYDLRRTIGFEDKKLKTYKWCLNRVTCNKNNVKRKLVDYCINKYEYFQMPLQELQDEFKLRGFKYMRFCICCSSCYSGMGNVLFNEIESQRQKYNGEYICKTCEKNAEIAGVQKEWGNHFGYKYMLTKDGFYYDEGVKPKDCKMLGFGGRWFIIKQKDKIWLTNNLFIATKLHKKLLDKFKNNINTEIIGIGFSNKDKDLQSTLSKDEFDYIKTTHGYELFKGC